MEEHHKRAEVAINRPAYREARREKAVKVYTVNQESKYLLVQNVHALGVTQELLQLFSLYGNIQEYRILDEYPSEPYTDVYWVKFEDIAAARVAKKKLDDRSFFGKNLHVSYAPEFESVEETREKLVERRATIAQKLKASHIREKKVRDQKQREEATRTEQLLQEGHSANIPPVSTPTTVIEVPLDTPSSTTLSSFICPPQALSDPSTSLSLQYGMSNTVQPMIPQMQYIHQIPPLHAPSVQGINAQQYPSQITHHIMGGALATPSSTLILRGKPDVASRPRPQATTAQSMIGNKRDRPSKRKFETHRPSEASEKTSKGEEGLYNRSGLSTSQRVLAFLSASGEGSSNSSTSVSTERESPPLKKRADERPKEPQTDIAIMATQQGLARETPLPNEGYFPVHQLTPLQTGNRSVDSSIQSVRKRMDKVWNEAIHTPSIQQPKKLKKRKRI